MICLILLVDIDRQCFLIINVYMSDLNTENDNYVRLLIKVLQIMIFNVKHSAEIML